KVTAAEIAKYMQILEKTPDRMTAASDKLTVAQLQGRPGSDEWSINDILAHLRACMDVWGKDIRTMLTEDNPRWRHLSPRTWLRKTNY
ncbi:MAG: DinB family protein, partial [Caldilineaceae bacterium]|nr:DinB family protein [Caldilineaceae bacterium]